MLPSFTIFRNDAILHLLLGGAQDLVLDVLVEGSKQ